MALFRRLNFAYPAGNEIVAVVVPMTGMNLTGFVNQNQHSDKKLLLLGMTVTTLGIKPILQWPGTKS